MKTYEQYTAESQKYNLLMQEAEQNAELAKQEQIKNNGIEAWIGYRFESSSSLTPEFAQFSQAMKKELTKRLTGYKIISYSRGHFFF